MLTTIRIQDVAFATQVAFDYRHQFRKDVIIDLIAYRRMGHNELDEPAFTQPIMYKAIRGRRSVPSLYEDRLVEEGVVTRQDVNEIRDAYSSSLEKCLEDTSAYKPKVSTIIYLCEIFILF